MDICSAAKKGNYERVKQLLEDGEDPNKEVWWMTSLHWASSRGHLRILKLIIEYGGDINRLTRWKYTPLMKATGNGRADCVAYLLLKGADPTLMNMEKKTAYDMAKGDGIRKLFDEHGQNPMDFYKKYKSRFEEFEVMSDSEDEEEVSKATQNLVDGTNKKKVTNPSPKKSRKSRKKKVKIDFALQPLTPLQPLQPKTEEKAPKKVVREPKKKTKKRKIILDMDDDDEPEIIEEDEPAEEEEEEEPKEQEITPEPQKVDETPETTEEESEIEEELIFNVKAIKTQEKKKSKSFKKLISKNRPTNLAIPMAKFKDYSEEDLPQSPVALTPTGKQKSSFSTLGDCLVFVFHPEEKKPTKRKKKRKNKDLSTILLYSCMAIRSPYLLEKLKKGDVRMELSTKYQPAVELIKCWLYGVTPQFEGNLENIAMTYSLALKWQLHQLRYCICTRVIYELSKSTYPPQKQNIEKDKKEEIIPKFEDCGPHFTKMSELGDVIKLMSLADERSGLYLQCLNLVKKHVSYDRLFHDNDLLDVVMGTKDSKLLGNLLRLLDPRAGQEKVVVEVKQHVEFASIDVSIVDTDSECVKKLFFGHLKGLLDDHQGTSNLKILAVDPEGKKEEKGKKQKKREKSQSLLDAEGGLVEESRKLFEVHREIMSHRSKYFRKKLKKSKDDLFLKIEIRPKIFQVMIKYIYQDHIDGIFFPLEHKLKIEEENEKKKEEEEEIEGETPKAEDEKMKNEKKTKNKISKKDQEKITGYGIEDIYDIRARAKKYYLEGLEDISIKAFTKKMEMERGSDALFQLYKENMRLKKILKTLRSAAKKKREDKEKKTDVDEGVLEEMEKMSMKRNTNHGTLPAKLAQKIRRRAVSSGLRWKGKKKTINLM